MTLRSRWVRDPWLVAAVVTTAAAYLALAWIRPTGENWGRGWNLVAFWFYSSPVVGIAGVVMCWRLVRGRFGLGLVSACLPMVALLYPLVAYFVIRAK